MSIIISTIVGNFLSWQDFIFNKTGTIVLQASIYPMDIESEIGQMIHMIKSETPLEGVKKSTSLYLGHPAWHDECHSIYQKVSIVR